MAPDVRCCGPQIELRALEDDAERQQRLAMRDVSPGNEALHHTSVHLPAFGHAGGRDTSGANDTLSAPFRRHAPRHAEAKARAAR